MDLQTLRKQYRKDILALASKYRLEDIRVFGSVARGDAGGESDLDLLVHPKKGCSLLKLCGFENRLKDMLGMEVDVVDDMSIHPRLKPYILAEVVAL